MTAAETPAVNGVHPGPEVWKNGPHRPDAVVAAVTALLDALGVDRNAHTADTPARVARYWADALNGYYADPARHLSTTFPGPATPALVCVTGIRFRSTCAHHMLPISGIATVAYRPERGAPIVGLSKLARVVAGYAARLQVQEVLGAQVCAAVADRLQVSGAACVITATHGCMTLRGVQQSESRTTTVALAGGWGDEALDVRDTLAEHRAAVAALGVSP